MGPYYLHDIELGSGLFESVRFIVWWEVIFVPVQVQVLLYRLSGG